MVLSKVLAGPCFNATKDSHSQERADFDLVPGGYCIACEHKSPAKPRERIVRDSENGTGCKVFGAEARVDGESAESKMKVVDGDGCKKSVNVAETPKIPSTFFPPSAPLLRLCLDISLSTERNALVRKLHGMGHFRGGTALHRSSQLAIVRQIIVAL